MNNLAKEITLINIEEEIKNSYLDYAMSVIIGRALPDVRDGLKPVHRRILYAMKILNNEWNKSYKKSARIVGDVIGKYHPHGDLAVYDTIVRMAQSFISRYVLIDGQGNFGSIDGDSAAAMRYTEIRMSKIANEFLTDLDKETINFVDNYDNSEKIPEILPTKIPNLLINGSSGIAVGMATNIPSHNINEIINACLAYINDNNITLTGLMHYIPGPDFPTGGIINGNKGIEDAYNTGKGIIYIRAKSKIEINKKTRKEKILIKEIPYQVNKSKLISNIVELIKEKKIEGISNIRDESDKSGMNIVIDIKREAVAKIVLNNLYSLTKLETSFGINMVALYQSQPRILNLKKIIKIFINHRREIITKRTIYELKKTEKKTHLLEGLMVALTNIDLIINLIKNSKTLNKAKKSLISHKWYFNISKKIKNIDFNKEKYKKKKDIHIKNNKFTYILTKKQIKAILNLKLHKLTNMEYKNILQKHNLLNKEIYKFKKILNNDNYLTSIIKKELNKIKQKFGDKRRTKIHLNKSNLKTKDLIDKKNVIVTLSNKGYIKYQLLSHYETQHRGGRGKSAAKIKKEDFIENLLITNTHCTILCFSSLGLIYWIKVYQLPKSTRNTKGKPIVNLLPLTKNERITAMLSIDKYKSNLYIFMATAYGIVKKTSLTKFKKERNKGIIAINLRDKDELINVTLTNGKNEIMLFSSMGKVVRFKENNIRTTNRITYGVKGIKLFKKDRLVSLIVPKKNGNILTVTENGYGKRTKIKEYPSKSRATQGVISIKINKRNGRVIGAVQVLDSDQVMIITNAATLVRIPVSEINIIKRNTQGVILIRIIKNEKVVELQRLEKSIINNIFIENINNKKE
ncbi:DNA topoisomerase (ATP-hydrolyzing) subunit A [Candidatus Purcelliella pentastirinorum]|uniref:DNA topoisomerase (ATP-hydrolyzing) subunit A n=1 Tax=Candidatus Purcelliella pentastirinorum TaxID=472834 RepID=UPI0023680C2C|nr:DNA topoisomerase (ATP-hydrolyzing) subunit A [Candidatus Purcelliella pentastirinorum]WDI79158.1 DNA topoisomerase (ATP-hydrolyzing) subunit A [Candidatus Purcelliella pentastirinorum]WDR80303.1 DNA topoisomerase (ATP-hydrolyzing) subunit A [Candidatus Purcelliella pentastirinorum]